MILRYTLSDGNLQDALIVNYDPIAKVVSLLTKDSTGATQSIVSSSLEFFFSFQN